MGFSDWSDAAFQARQTHRHKTGQSAFTYDDFVRQSGVVRVHDQMNPHGVMRESRDSAQHPTSLAIGVVFDVTGSKSSRSIAATNVFQCSHLSLSCVLPASVSA